MARNLGTVLFNNFSRGLITEATGLNFPDNAVTESDNVVFERIGRVVRRLGIDLEGEASSTGYGGDATAGVLREYLWEAVAKQGGFTFLVIQMGAIIRFYEMNKANSVSAGTLPIGIDLRDFKVPGSPPINDVPVSFTAGAGYLYIGHPSCNPILVKYDSETEEFTQLPIEIYTRDLEGIEDGLAPDTEPTELTPEHAYNLKNQGWYKRVRVGTVNNEPGDSAPTSGGFDYKLWGQIVSGNYHRGDTGGREWLGIFDPPGGSTISETTTFHWTPSGEIQYTIRIGTSVTGGDDVLAQSVVVHPDFNPPNGINVGNSTEYTATGLPPGDIYVQVWTPKNRGKPYRFTRS